MERGSPLLMIRRLELTPGGPTGRRTLAEEAAAELHELILSGELPKVFLSSLGRMVSNRCSTAVLDAICAEAP